MSKDPYSKITKDERDEMDKLDEDQLNKKIAQVAKNDSAMEEARKMDEDLEQAKERLKVCQEPYKESRAANKQRIAYLRSLLSGKGKDSGTSPVATSSATDTAEG